MSETIDKPLDGMPQTRTRLRPPRHRVASRHQRQARREGEQVRAVSVSVPAALAQRWRAHSQATRSPLLDVLLDAVRARETELPDLVAARQAEEDEARRPVSDGMFLRSPDRSGETYVTIPLRMVEQNIIDLDRLAVRLAADTRSQLVVAALTAHLDEHAAS